MPLVVTYVCATMGPLIKYYQFPIHIKCEFLDFKLNPNAT